MKDSRTVAIRRIDCETCRNYAWIMSMNPIKDVHGQRHHPSCPRVSVIVKRSHGRCVR